MGAAVVAFAALVGLLVFSGRESVPGSDGKSHLLVMAAAGLREPMERIAAEYQREHGVRVNIQFGGSNSLLNQLQVDQISTPDLFLAADQSYTLLAVHNGLASRTLPVATQRPVVIVRKNSAIRIESFDNLLAEGLRLSLADPDQAAIGRTVRSTLSSLSPEHWRRLEQQVKRWGVFKPTVNDVAGDVQIGAVDAGIVWDTTVSSPAYEGAIEVITLPEISGQPEQVTAALLRSSKQPAEAWKFAQYLTDPARGQQIFCLHGFGRAQIAENRATNREGTHDLQSSARPSASQEDGLE